MNSSHVCPKEKIILLSRHENADNIILYFILYLTVTLYIITYDFNF